MPLYLLLVSFNPTLLISEGDPLVGISLTQNLL